MNKLWLLVLIFLLSMPVYRASAGENAAEPTAATPAASPDTPSPATPVAASAPAATESVPVAESATSAAEALSTVESAATTPAPASAEDIKTENLEFISGEISAVDETAKSITVKIYGETENNAPEKTISITLDDTTDITDGEKDRDLKSLTAGTEVDVEYDPASNKATYIFVY